MSVPAVNIVIEKGTDFSTTFKIKKDGAALDLTGYTFSVKLRKHYSAITYYTFSATGLTPLSTGMLKISMPKATTSSIPVGRYVYDVLITLSGTTTKVIEGNVLVKGTVS